MKKPDFAALLEKHPEAWWVASHPVSADQGIRARARRRRRLAIIAVVVACLMAVAGAGGAAWGFREIRSLREALRGAEARARAKDGVLEALLARFSGQVDGLGRRTSLLEGEVAFLAATPACPYLAEEEIVAAVERAFHQELGRGAQSEEAARYVGLYREREARCDEGVPDPEVFVALRIPGDYPDESTGYHMGQFAGIVRCMMNPPDAACSGDSG